MNGLFDLTGKVAVVTGSSRGLGLASAKALAGAIEAIRDAKPVIAMSLHSQHEWFDSCGLLKPIGYVAHRIEDDAVLPWESYPGTSTVALRVPE